MTMVIVLFDLVPLCQVSQCQVSRFQRPPCSIKLVNWRVTRDRWNWPVCGPYARQPLRPCTFVPLYHHFKDCPVTTTDVRRSGWWLFQVNPAEPVTCGYWSGRGRLYTT